MTDIDPDDLLPTLGTRSEPNCVRGTAYTLVAVLAFLAGLFCSQCRVEQSPGKSRIEWPDTKQDPVQNPRKVL